MKDYFSCKNERGLCNSDQVAASDRMDSWTAAWMARVRHLKIWAIVFQAEKVESTKALLRPDKFFRPVGAVGKKVWQNHVSESEWCHGELWDVEGGRNGIGIVGLWISLNYILRIEESLKI